MFSDNILFIFRLSILLNGLHERDPVRYNVYCTQVKVAGKSGLIDHIIVPLEQVSCVEMLNYCGGT